ncbi:MAG: hypothetical protein OMM_00947 [Candidatus Magnetoglobus multicellularis str. Araruama]|uniref:Uncharacterized protein n=1 Tax=Candidatus Magnetoglobus multicellularis str. Araruama TaxID=890399 RepID=A0A1V1PFK0_9BACT|nr:MAG: hypothetical protein OMM_00947 [Candidatus Magnetoglobus multicellularis str. Araruama]
MRHPFILSVIILSVFSLNWAIASDNPQIKDQKQVQQKAKSKGQQKSTIENNLKSLISNQQKYHKSLQALGNQLDKQEVAYKKFQSDVTTQLHGIKKQINEKLDQMSDATKANQEMYREELLAIDKRIQSLTANLFAALSESAQQNINRFQEYEMAQSNQIADITKLVQTLTVDITADQSQQYSAIEESSGKLSEQIMTINDRLGQIENQIPKNAPDIEQAISEQFTDQKTFLNSIETNIKTLVTNSNAQLNANINDSIKQLKTDFSRFKQDIKDTMDQVSSQVIEIKHEQQIELQSLVKQLTRELNRHDQNILDSLIKAEQSLDTGFLTWLIYGLIILIIGLIIFIIWDRNSTVAPLIDRIRKLEDNLVIEY